MITSSRSGVTFGSVDESIARYWTYREFRDREPGAAMVWKPDHVPSSAFGELPVRMLITLVVPRGLFAVHWTVFQMTAALASNTREVKVPHAAQGVPRIQSITMFPPKTLKSLAATARIGPGTATVCVATTVPSMENTTLASVQSIVYLWGNPRTPVPRGVSIAAVPVLVRAVSAPPLIVLKIAHGCVALERSCANPECWNASPVNVAMNCRR